MPLAKGEAIAGYTILRSLGAGGMGEVYLARHPRLPRRDALKVLAPSVSSDGEYRARFEREAEIAATLWHPHIVEIHDRGDVDGQLWISMDYVEGIDAGRLLAEQYSGGMPADLVIRLVSAVASALDYAHGKGLTHRDVKPANILVANPGAEDERILLADFGIARRIDDTSNLTGTNMTVGTVAYAAPEQLTGELVDGRTDQYALASTAFQLLTGAPPFENSNPAVVISAHLTKRPPPIGSRRPELTNLGTVFDRALAKAPDERFVKCVDFARALAHQVDGPEPALAGSSETVRARASSGPRHAKPVVSRPTRGHRWRNVALVAGVVVLLAAVGSAVFLAFDDHRDRDQVATNRVAVPVVVVGANCATLGAAGVTEAGAQAYCAHLTANDAELWSLYSGDLAAPPAAAPGEQTYAPATETPVLLCMQQTGVSKARCHDDIVRENADPTANDTLAPSPTG